MEDPEVAHWVDMTRKGCLIKPGKVYNVYTLDKERERITNFLNNNGYFGFVKDYIFFEVDSTQGVKQMDLFLKVKNITLGYTFSDKTLEGLPFSSLRLYSSARNPFILHSELFDGLDPERGGSTSWPLARLWVIGLDTSF